MPLVSEAQWAEYKRLRRLAGYPDDQYPGAHEAATAGEARAVADEFEAYVAGISKNYHKAAVYWMDRAEAAERASTEGPACDTAWDRVRRLEDRVTLIESHLVATRPDSVWNRPPECICGTTYHCDPPGIGGHKPECPCVHAVCNYPIGKFTCGRAYGHEGEHSAGLGFKG